MDKIVGNNSEEKKILYNSIVKSTEIQEFLITELRETTRTITELTQSMKDLRRDVNQLLKIVRDGNGERSLIQKVDRLEGSFNSFHESSTKDKEGRLALILAGIAFVGTLGAAIIQAMS